MDRIDVKQYVPGPSIRMRYEIFRRSYTDLLASNIVTTVSRETHDKGVAPEESTDRSLESWQIIDRDKIGANEILPAYEGMEVSFRMDKKSVPYKLREIAEKSAVGTRCRAGAVTDDL